MPSLGDLKKSKFLKRSDVSKPTLCIIDSYEEVNVAKEGAEPEMRWALWLKEFDKPFVLNSTNGQLIAHACGSEDFDGWIGKQIVLFDDPTISFGGKLVGGIRVRAPKNQITPAAKAAGMARLNAVARPAPKPEPEYDPAQEQPGCEEEVPF